MDEQNAESSDLPPSYDEAIGTGFRIPPETFQESESANVHRETSSQQNQSSRLQRPTNLDIPQVHSSATAHNEPNRVIIRENISSNRTNIELDTLHRGPERSIIYGSRDPATIARLTALTSICPNCGNHTILKAYTEPTLKTHLSAIILFLLGCFLYSCIPYLLDCCKTAHVYCSHCNYYLGTYDDVTGRRSCCYCCNCCF